MLSAVAPKPAARVLQLPSALPQGRRDGALALLHLPGGVRRWPGATEASKTAAGCLQPLFEGGLESSQFRGPGVGGGKGGVGGREAGDCMIFLGDALSKTLKPAAAASTLQHSKLVMPHGFRGPGINIISNHYN